MAASSSQTFPREAVASLVDRTRRDVEGALARICDRHLAPEAEAVADAIRYSLGGAGKRVRALLVCAAYQSVGGQQDVSELAASLEVVHAYSLIHDDLPSMDDDDLRRGRPSVHRAFDVRTATAAGLAMVPLGTKCAFDAALRLGLDPRECALVVREVLVAAGGGGMIAGQLLDLEAEGGELTRDALERIHRCKTGALIAASAVVGGMAARGSGSKLSALRRFGELIGLAFQIADDLLDVVATSSELGKTAGKDVAWKKSTYPLLFGLEGARLHAAELAKRACGELEREALLTPFFEHLAGAMIRRRS